MKDIKKIKMGIKVPVQIRDYQILSFEFEVTMEDGDPVEMRQQAKKYLLESMLYVGTEQTVNIIDKFQKNVKQKIRAKE
jgi:hypothetical protein